MEPMKYAHLTRQLDLIPLEILNEPITVIGAGAIGSLTVLNLVKMGFQNMTVYDFDRVEVENMNSQFYRFKDIGLHKVEALKNLIKEFTNIEIEAIPEKYEKGTFQGIVISAVDSMAVRKSIWDNHKNIGVFTKAIIDPRMSIEDGKLYCMRPLNEKDVITYEKTLYSDEQSVQERCTAKSTIYTAGMLSGLVAKTVKDVLMGVPYARVAEWSIHNGSLSIWK